MGVPVTARRPVLTAQDHHAIAKARELAALTSINAAIALGEAQAWLTILADLAERLAAPTGAPAEDTRRLTAIRELLRHFDWEYHDRQLALEAIERIAEGAQP